MISDMDFYEALNGPSDVETEMRQDDEARDARWTAFVQWIGVKLVLLTPEQVITEAGGSLRKTEWSMADYREFAETEGVDGLLSAIARAIREQRDALLVRR